MFAQMSVIPTNVCDLSTVVTNHSGKESCRGNLERFLLGKVDSGSQECGGHPRNEWHEGE